MFHVCSKPNCTFCDQAKALLSAKNLMLAHKWGIKSHYYHLVEKEGAVAAIKQAEAEPLPVTEPSAQPDEDYVCESCVL